MDAEVERVAAKAAAMQEARVEEQKKIPESRLAREIAGQWRTRFAFDQVSMTWHEFGQRGYWEPVGLYCVKSALIEEITRALEAGFRIGLVNNILTFLEIFLGAPPWQKDRKLLPLRNGVLNLDTLELSPSNAEHWFNWQLPYDYDPDANFPEIERFLTVTTNNDAGVAKVLFSVLAAIIRGMDGVHKFVEIVGPGGTGKTTFLRLAQELIGERNTAATELKQLEQNRFETAALYQKRLILLGDQGHYCGSVDTLKRLTGSDPIRFERKYQQQGENFISDAIVMIAANEPLSSKDYTSGLARRRLSISFEQKIENPDPAMPDKMRREIPGLLNHLLQYKPETIRRLISESHKVSALRRVSAEHLVQTNPMAAWVNERLIQKSGARCGIGTRQQPPAQFLYPSYSAYCDSAGVEALALNRFRRGLRDLLRDQLGWDVTDTRDGQGAYIAGVDIYPATSGSANSIMADMAENIF